MEPCLVEADRKSTFAVFRGGLSRRVGSKRGVENKAEYINTKEERSPPSKFWPWR